MDSLSSYLTDIRLKAHRIIRDNNCYDMNRHIACVFNPNNMNILSIGINHIVGQNTSILYNSIHAEMDAFRRLKPIGHGRKKVYMLVIRESRGELRNSKPCHKCEKMMRYFYKKGYDLQRIYYSTGCSQKYNFIRLD